MPERNARSLSTAFIIVLASIPLATITRGETAPPDSCLSEPKAETPPGSHWHYRVDHANKRNCWYLRSEGGVSQALPQNTSTAPAPVATKPSVADARAELRAQASREGGTAVGPAAAASPPANTQRSTPWPAPPPTEAAPAASAPRWPEPAATSPSPVPNSAAPAAANSADNPPQATANLPVAAAASAPADPPTPIHLGVFPGLIVAGIGALAFAIAAATLIARRRRVRLPRHRKMSRARAPIWEMTDDDRIVIEDQPPSRNRNYEPRFARGAGSAKVQQTKTQQPKVQPKVQQPKIQHPMTQAAKSRGDRRTEFPPRMPRSASR
jgi:hypothetical protein